jgi:hypothetical protein
MKKYILLVRDDLDRPMLAALNRLFDGNPKRGSLWLEDEQDRGPE